MGSTLKTFYLFYHLTDSGGIMTEQSDLTIGNLAPEFSLPDGSGTEIKLADFRSKSNVVLFFIREFN
jgi:hypothetical protein